jgi:hypothetical protein
LKELLSADQRPVECGGKNGVKVKQRDRTPDLSAVENDGLSATDVPQGQEVSGPIAVDVPLGKAITQIVLTNGLGGTQLSLWFS